MEIQVFNNARDGKLYELKNILDHKHDDEVATLVSALTDEATPLVMACKNGHLDVVTYLLEECHADVEQVGLIEGLRGTPVYWAATSGHLDIVKTLIKYNASLEHTLERSSPLVAASINGNLEIGKYLIEHHGVDIELPYDDEEGYFTCLMYTCVWGHYEFAKYLLECGAAVNKSDYRGMTALHLCIRTRSLELIKLLLEYGATMSKDKEGLTPLLSAASVGFKSTVEYFLKEYNCTKQERVDALELLGAAVAHENDMTSARDFWRRALELRYEDSAFPLEKPEDKSPMSSYINANEWRSLDELDELADDEMELQALMVRVRILGQCPSASIDCIRSRGNMYAENGNFKKCIQLWKYILDSKFDGDGYTYIIIKDFTAIFYKMMYETWDAARNMPNVAFSDVLYVLESALLAVKRCAGMDFSDIPIFFDSFTEVLHLVNLMNMLKPFLDGNEEISFKKVASELVYTNPKAYNGFSFLHFASFKDPSPIRQLPNIFPSQSVVEVLLEVGASVNEVDFSNNTPLHVAAMNRPFDTSVFYSLLNQGAHLDLCNNESKTPLQLLPDSALLHINILHHLNLQCLCAQAIHKHKIYYKGYAPKNVCEFVESHGSH